MGIVTGQCGVELPEEEHIAGLSHHSTAHSYFCEELRFQEELIIRGTGWRICL